VQEAGWDPEPVLTLRRRKISFAPTESFRHLGRKFPVIYFFVGRCVFTTVSANMISYGMWCRIFCLLFTKVQGSTSQKTVTLTLGYIFQFWHSAQRENITASYSGKRFSSLFPTVAPSSHEVRSFTRRVFRRRQQPLVRRQANLSFTGPLQELNCRTLYVKKFLFSRVNSKLFSTQ
jgi:hypothetical protein